VACVFSNYIAIAFIGSCAFTEALTDVYRTIGKKMDADDFTPDPWPKSKFKNANYLRQ